MKDRVDKKFNKRGFVAVSMITAGLALPVSGIINHQLQCAPITMERHFWMAVHNMSALLFFVFTLLHILFNRRSLLHHLKNMSGKVNREAVLAVLLVALLVVLFSSHALHVG